MVRFTTLTELLRHVVESYANPRAFNFRNGKGWLSISTREFGHAVVRTALDLRTRGVERGEAVGLMAPSSPQWVIADLAILLAGGVTVPIFADISPANLAFELRDANIRTIIAGGDLCLAALEPHRGGLASVIDVRDRIGALGRPGTNGGEEDLAPSLLSELCSQIREDDLATIIYTSGSTGLPKGVELTHRSVVSQVEGSRIRFDFAEGPTDAVLSALPLAHIFERMVTYYYISRGISIYFVDDVKLVGDYMREVRPTYMEVVPRLLEKAHAKMRAQIEAERGAKGAIARAAFLRAERKPAETARRGPAGLLADLLVYRKLRDAMGGRFRAVISGGAPLSKEMGRFFANIGLPLYEGYGLTEASPVIACNCPGANRVGTVGKAFPGVEIRVAEDGEILARGPNIMRAYHRDGSATEGVIDSGGWLHTGDLGSLDTEGYLTITGRKKELFKTSTGEYVSPVPIEQALCRCRLVDMALVIAEDRKYLTCLLFPDFEEVALRMDEVGAHRQSVEDFLMGGIFRMEIEEHIRGVNRSLNHWEQIRRFRVVPGRISIDGGELTPSLKIRRHLVEEKFKDLIEGMYQN